MSTPCPYLGPASDDDCQYAAQQAAHAMDPCQTALDAGDSGLFDRCIHDGMNAAIESADAWMAAAQRDCASDNPQTDPGASAVCDQLSAYLASQTPTPLLNDTQKRGD